MNKISLSEHLDKLPKNLVAKIAQTELDIIGLKAENNSSSGARAIRHPTPVDYIGRRNSLREQHRSLVNEAMNVLKGQGVV